MGGGAETAWQVAYPSLCQNYRDFMGDVTKLNLKKLNLEKIHHGIGGDSLKMLPDFSVSSRALYGSQEVCK